MLVGRVSFPLPSVEITLGGSVVLNEVPTMCGGVEAALEGYLLGKVDWAVPVYRMPEWGKQC